MHTIPSKCLAMSHPSLLPRPKPWRLHPRKLRTGRSRGSQSSPRGTSVSNNDACRYLCELSSSENFITWPPAPSWMLKAPVLALCRRWDLETCRKERKGPERGLRHFFDSAASAPASIHVILVGTHFKQSKCHFNRREGPQPGRKPLQAAARRYQFVGATAKIESSPGSSVVGPLQVYIPKVWSKSNNRMGADFRIRPPSGPESSRSRGLQEG